MDDATGTEAGTETSTETESDAESEDSTTGSAMELGACAGAGALSINATPGVNVDLRVTGEDFQVVFGEGQRHVLSAYTVEDGPNLLFDELSVSERLSGVGLFAVPPDQGTAYSYTDLNGSALEVELFAAGPALVQFYVLWGDHSPNVDSLMQGSTIFTITPDGRVIRDEQVFLLFDFMDTGYWATEYFAVDAEHVATYDHGLQQGSTNVDFGMRPFQIDKICNDSSDCDTWLRTSGPEYEMTLASHRLDGGGSWSGEVAGRVTQVSSIDTKDNYAVTLQFDWQRAQEDAHAGELNVEELRGAFFMHGDAVPTDGCGPVLAEAFLRPPAVDQTSLIGATLATSTFEGISGDYDDDGYYESGGFYGFEALQGDAFDVSWGGDLPSVLMFVESATTVSEVRIGGETVPEALWFTQLEVGTRTFSDVAWLYLGVEIEAGTAVTVVFDR